MMKQVEKLKAEAKEQDRKDLLKEEKKLQALQETRRKEGLSQKELADRQEAEARQRMGQEAEAMDRRRRLESIRAEWAGLNPPMFVLSLELAHWCQHDLMKQKGPLEQLGLWAEAETFIQSVKDAAKSKED